jgi:hypothetical protein
VISYIYNDNDFNDLLFNFLKNKQVQENDLLNPNDFNGEYFFIKNYNSDHHIDNTIVKI